MESCAHVIFALLFALFAISLCLSAIPVLVSLLAVVVGVVGLIIVVVRSIKTGRRPSIWVIVGLVGIIDVGVIGLWLANPWELIATYGLDQIF